MASGSDKPGQGFCVQISSPFRERFCAFAMSVWRTSSYFSIACLPVLCGRMNVFLHNPFGVMSVSRLFLPFWRDGQNSDTGTEINDRGIQTHPFAFKPELTISDSESRSRFGQDLR